MKARSPRLSDFAAKMAGSEAAGYKRIQRFLQDNDPREALKTLFNEEAEFVILVLIFEPFLVTQAALLLAA